MKFEYEGSTYRIEFQRDKKKLHRPGIVDGAESTYPYTTARLLKHFKDDVMEGYETIAHAQVGCWHKEAKFTLEQGRVEALRKLTKELPKDLRREVWKAYHERDREPVVNGEVING